MTNVSLDKGPAQKFRSYAIFHPHDFKDEQKVFNMPPINGTWNRFLCFNVL
jgi:hypothetical protein